MLTWSFFVLFVFGENDSHCVCFEENQFIGSVLDCVAPCLEESLLSLAAKLRLEEVWKSFTEHTKRVDVWLK